MSWWLKAAILSPCLWVWGLWYPQSDPGHMLFLVLLVGGVGLSRGAPRPSTLRHVGSTPTASILLAVWAGAILLTTFISSSPWATFFSVHNRGEGAMQHLLYVVLLAALLQVRQREELLTWVILLCAGSLLVGLTHFGWHDPEPRVPMLPGYAPAFQWPRLQGGLGNPLFLAALMPFGIWASLKKRWWHMAMVFTVALVATLGKGAILGLVMAVLFWLWHTQRYTLGFLGTLGLTGALFALPTPGSGNIRIGLWEVAVKGIIHKPWGWGAENYPLVWDRFFQWTLQDSGYPVNWHDRAHNMVLDRAIEWGVVGCVAFVALLVLAYSKGGPLEKACFIAYGVGSIFVFDTHANMIALLCLVAYCIGGDDGGARNGGGVWRSRRSGRISRVRAAIGVCELAAALTVASLSLWQANRVFYAATYQDLLDAAAIPSPVGHFGAGVAQKYLRQPKQTPASIAAVEEFVPEGGPLRTPLLHLLAIHDRERDRGRCEALRKWAPYRLDSQILCEKVDKEP